MAIPEYLKKKKTTIDPFKTGSGALFSYVGIKPGQEGAANVQKSTDQANKVFGSFISPKPVQQSVQPKPATPSLVSKLTQTATSGVPATQTVPKTVPTTVPQASLEALPPVRPVTPRPEMLTEKQTTPMTDDEIKASILRKSLKQQYGDSLTDQELDFIVKQQTQQAQDTSVEDLRKAQEAQLKTLTDLRAGEEARLAAERERMKEENARVLEQFKASQEAQAQEAIAEAQRTGKVRTAQEERLLGTRGNLTSTVGAERLGDIERQTSGTINAINARKNAEIALKQAQLEGASEEQLQAMSTQVQNLRATEAQAIMDAEVSLQQAKIQAQQLGQESQMKLIQTALDNLSTEKVKSKADAALTKNISDGYVYDEFGQRITDAEGNLITYETPQELDLLTIGAGQTVIDKKTGLPIYSTPEKPQFQKIGDTTYQIDSYGNLAPITEPVSPQVNSQALTQAKQQINKIDEILNDPNFGKVFGLSQYAGSSLLPQAQEVKNKVDNLIASLTIDERGKLKGSGAISDFESRLIQQSATALGRNLTDTQAKKVLEDIRTKFENVEKTQYLSNAFGISQNEAALQLENIKEQAGSYPTLQELQSEFPSFNKPATLGLNGPLNKAVAQKFPPNSTGGQCTTFLHKIADFPSIGDGLNAKKASVDKIGIPKSQWTPQAGDIVVSDENPTYGHTFMISQILPGGKAQVIESNYKGNEKVTYNRIVDLNSKNIYGAIRGTLKIA